MNLKILLAVLLLLLVCGFYYLFNHLDLIALWNFNDNPKAPEFISRIISSKPQLQAQYSTKQGTERVVEANNTFALNLYKTLITKEKGNIFYSPYSLSAALAITYEGAKGQTAQEIADVFGFPQLQDLRPNFAAIYRQINQTNNNYQLSTGNALWAQKGYQFLPEYISNIEKYYGGKTTNLDFVYDSENSRVTINTYIEKQTKDKIKDLIPQGTLNNLTRLVLTNAIYFKGEWIWQFDKKNTKDEEFNISLLKKVKTPLMHLDNEKTSFQYAETPEMQAIELPYKGDGLSMLIILPKTNLGNFENSISLDKLNEWKSLMKDEKVEHIYIPKFKFDTKYFMVDALSKMGMPNPFSPQADFSGMDGAKNLYISDVIHQAFVQVDEQGTEAAAATAVIMEFEMAIVDQNKPIIFRADHPFLFIIQQKSTGNILFMGRVIDPSK